MSHFKKSGDKIFWHPQYFLSFQLDHHKNLLCSLRPLCPIILQKVSHLQALYLNSSFNEYLTNHFSDNHSQSDVPNHQPTDGLMVCNSIVGKKSFSSWFALYTGVNLSGGHLTHSEHCAYGEQMFPMRQHA
jgi:hypothetical protein